MTTSRHREKPDAGNIVKRLVTVFSLLATVSAVAANTYYWTGASDGKELFTAGNWATSDGSVASSAPVQGDTIVFTNDTALLLSASKNIPSLFWRFEGSANVTGPGNTDGSKTSYTFMDGGGIYAAPSDGCVHKLDYSVYPQGDIPVEVGAGTIVWLSGYGTTEMLKNSRLVKKGAGRQNHARLYWHGSIRLEEGFLYSYISNSNGDTALEVVGGSLKEIGAADSGLTIQSYVESPEALNTLTFKTISSSDQTLTLKGTAGSVTRCSADIKNSYSGSPTYQLIWDPENDARLDLVGRLYDTLTGKIYAKSGSVRFADDAGIAGLNEIRVGAGTTVEIDASTSNKFTEATWVVEEGGVLKVDGSKTEDWKANAASESDLVVKKGQLTWEGQIDICGIRRVYLDASSIGWSSIGGAKSALRFSGSSRHRLHVLGGQTDVTVGDYSEAPEAENHNSITCYTSQPNTFTIAGSQDTRYSADIYNLAGGTFTLVWDPVDATKMLTVVKHVYGSTRSAFEVKKGTMRFAEGAGITAASSKVTVGAGARFEVARDAQANFENTEFVLADATAKLMYEGDGAACTVKSLSIGGTAIPAGFYTAATASWITGTGAVIVGELPAEGASVVARWTGGGTTAAITDPNNWGGALPDLKGNAVVATFPAGARVSVPANEIVFLKGIVSEGTDFSLSGEESSVVALGSLGITIPAAAVNATCSINCPIFLTKAQNWQIGKNVTLDLLTKAHLSSVQLPTGCIITQTGNVNYRATSNGLRADVSVTGVDAQTTSVMAIYADNALGDARCTVLQETNFSYIQLHGCALDCGMTLFGKDRATHLEATEGVSILNGKILPRDSNEGQYTCKAGAKLIFRGGIKYVEGSNGSSWSPTGPYDVVVENNPMDVEKVALGTVDQQTAFHLNVASNRFPRGLFFRYGAAANLLYTEVPYALYPDGKGGVSFHSDAQNAVWDLCGCDQAVTIFFSRTLDAVVRSDTAATLHLVDDALNYEKLTEPDAAQMRCTMLGTASQVDRTTFAGLASFSKEGRYTHYMMGASTSTGAVTVAKGRLIFTKASNTPITLPQEKQGMSGPEAGGYTFTPLKGSWRNASEAVVTGGVLELQHGSVFSKATDVKVSGDGVIDLAAGVVQKCHTLTIGETVYDAGTWGGLDSNAEHKDAHFAGTGKLLVLGETTLGLAIILK